MAAKHMKIKKIVLSIIAIAILTSQLAGCATISSSELVDLINEGETIVLEISVPEGEALDTMIETAMTPTELAQLDTYTENGFRNEFDKLFSVNKVTSGDINTKQGCMYVINNGTEEVQNGNTSLRDAFGNRIFTKYMNYELVRSDLADLAEKAYVDVDATDSCAINASLNAYFNLIAEEYNDATYGASRTLTRDQFTMALYNSTHSSASLNDIQNLMWLQSENGSLNTANKSTAISKIEAIYAIVNLCFKDKMEAVDLTKTATVFNYKNGGDIATEIGAKESTASKAWQNNVLAYMVANPDEGVQQELMQALVIAEKAGLLDGIATDLYGAITKDEAIQLIVNAYEAESKLTSFKTNTEYAKLVTNTSTAAPTESTTNNGGKVTNSGTTGGNTGGTTGNTNDTTGGTTGNTPTDDGLQQGLDFGHTGGVDTSPDQIDNITFGSY